MTQENDPLAALDGAFQTTVAESDEAAASHLPDGVYLMTIEDSEVTLSKSSQQVMWQTTLVVLAGPKKNRKTWKRHMLTKDGQPKQDALPAVKADLDLLKANITKLPELRVRAKELKGRVLLVKVVTPKEFTNVYYQRLIVDAAEVASLTAQMNAGAPVNVAPGTPVVGAPAGAGVDFGGNSAPVVGAPVVTQGGGTGGGASGDIPF